MRVLFTFSGGAGHAEPLVPIARAVEAAGHTVAFAGRAWVVARLQASGFTVFADPASPDAAPRQRMPLVEVDMEREFASLRAGFADRLARARADATRVLATAWKPDVIVREETDFGAAIAAERLGIPCATVLIIAAGSFLRREWLVEPLNALRAEYGLPPDPDLAQLGRDLVVGPFPPSLRDPDFPLPATAHSIRLPSPPTPAPAWLTRLPHARTIYFTLGTVFNVESGDLFSRVVTGLSELPANLVVTVGPQIDPVAELGVQPAHVRVERYVPQAAVLPGCDLVVHHGGSGSVLGALSYGLPQVVVPMGADQPLTADRVEALHLGRVLNALVATPADVRAAAEAVLTDPTYRRAAERVKAELDALPGPASLVPLIEGLARRSR